MHIDLPHPSPNPGEKVMAMPPQKTDSERILRSNDGVTPRSRNDSEIMLRRSDRLRPWPTTGFKNILGRNGRPRL